MSQTLKLSDLDFESFGDPEPSLIEPQTQVSGALVNSAVNQSVFNIFGFQGGSQINLCLTLT